ncbi:hypothetical protein ACXJJ3_32030 [Kribbella sp. WER1]
MTSDYEGPGSDDLPDDAAEADVLEQRRATDDGAEQGDLPTEADPADVEAQRHPVSDTGDEDDYR